MKIKNHRSLLLLSCLLFSQSLFCSDDVPWYRTFEAGLAVGTVMTAVCAGLVCRRAYNKQCEFRYHSHVRLNDLFAESEVLQQQVTAMGTLIACQACDLSYVRRLNKVLLSLERESTSVQKQSKNNKAISALLRKEKKVAFGKIRKKPHRGR